MKRCKKQQHGLRQVRDTICGFINYWYKQGKITVDLLKHYWNNLEGKHYSDTSNYTDG